MNPFLVAEGGYAAVPVIAVAATSTRLLLSRVPCVGEFVRIDGQLHQVQVVAHGANHDFGNVAAFVRLSGPGTFAEDGAFQVDGSS